jgi:LysR family transcriptional regulator, transcription activator of glutamate synthase operon
MNVDTDVLRWFQQVTDGVTVTEVGERHWVSQPAVSRGLARLEAEVGVPLLRRNGRALRMTPAGEMFKRHVDTFLAELDGGLAAVQQLIDPATGVVAVAFQASLGAWLVPRLIGTFRADHPNVRFVLGQARDEFVPGMLEAGKVDVGITTVRTSDPGVRWQWLMSEQLYLAVPGAHPLADRSEIGLGEVSAERFVMLRKPSPLRDQIDQLCHGVGFEPQLAFEVEDLPTVRGFVAAGLGVGVIPATQDGPSAFAQSVVRLLGITDQGACREISLAWSAERRLLPSAEAFRWHIIEQARGQHLPETPMPTR